MRHAYHQDPNQKIEVTLEDDKDRIVFKIRDYGEKIDLAKVKAPELPPKKGGGLGIHFMKSIMDEVQYDTGHPQGNELILTKYKNENSGKD